MERSLNVNTVDQPETSKSSENAGTKIFPTKKIDQKKNFHVSKTCDVSMNVKSFNLSPKQKALQLLEELKNAIEKLSNFDRENCSVPFYDVQSTSNSTKHQFASVLNSESPYKEQSQELITMMEENQRLKSSSQKKQQILIDLAATYEELNEELNKKKEELFRLQSHEQSINIKRISEKTIASHMQSHSTSHPSSLSVLFEEETRSLGGSSMARIKRTELEKKLESVQGSVKQLNDMNNQWLAYNQTQGEEIKQLERKVKEQQQEIARLEAQQTDSVDPNSITFTPAQQIYIDNEYQRIRQTADRYRDQRDATVEDAQRTIGAAARKRDEAVRDAGELRVELEQFERDSRARAEQQEELQTALLVATRSSQQPSSDQQLVNSLRNAARQHEDELRRINEEYQRVIRENASLKDQLRQRSHRMRETIVSHSPGGSTTTVMRSGDGSRDSTYDVEFD